MQSRPALSPALSVVRALPLRADSHTYGLDGIARRLGHYGRSTAWLLDYVRALTREAHFPAPLPALRRGRGSAMPALVEGIDAIRPSARWDRRAVDAWFDDRLPPGALDAAETSRLAADAAALDARAAQLAGAA